VFREIGQATIDATTTPTIDISTPFGLIAGDRPEIKPGQFSINATFRHCQPLVVADAR